MPDTASDRNTHALGSDRSAKVASDAKPALTAKYRDTFAVAEYRAVFAASTLSWIGDSLTRVALSYLIYRDTSSVLLSALTFAISFLPWLLGGPVLSAIAERHPYRGVMLTCDVVRMAIVALIAIPGMPLPGMLLLLLASAMLTPPFESARSAMLPQLLTGDRYVVAVSLQNVSAQLAQAGGFVLGGGIAIVNPRIALVIDAVTFGLSALCLWRGVPNLPAATGATQQSGLFRESLDGIQVVFGTRLLRSIAIMVYVLACFAIVPGLAAPWAKLWGADGWVQGVLMAASHIGVVVGSVVVGRLVTPTARRRLIRPLAVLAPAALVPALLHPPPWIVIPLVVISGFALSCLIPVNALFVQELPREFRARAFGVMQAGIQILQGLAVLATGALGGHISVPIVVGVWGLAGTLGMLAICVTWPLQGSGGVVKHHAKS